MKFSRYAALAVVGAALSGLAARAQSNDNENRVVKVINRASDPIYHLYISNVDENSWGPDQLGYFEWIGTNRYRNFNMDDGTGHCLYDIKAVLSDGREAIQSHFNVCSSSSFSVVDN